MRDRHRAVLSAMNALRVAQVQDLIEPVIRAGMKRFDLDYWEFVTRQPTKPYAGEDVGRHLRDFETLPAADSFHWLLSHNGIKGVKAYRKPDDVIDVYWEYH